MQMRGQTFEAEPLQRPCGRKETTYYGPASETGRSLDPLQTEGSITVPHPRPSKELRMCSILIEHRSSWLAASQAGIIDGASSFPEVSKPLGEKSENPFFVHSPWVQTAQLLHKGNKMSGRGQDGLWEENASLSRTLALLRLSRPSPRTQMDYT